MRGDDSMEATTRVTRSMQRDRTGRPPTAGRRTVSAGELGSPSKDLRIKAVGKHCNQDDPKHHQIATPPEGRVYRSLLCGPVLNPERLKTAKALADKAIKTHKIFSIQGPYPVIRSALKARGWVEQRFPRPNRFTFTYSRRNSDEGRAGSVDAADNSDGDDDNSEDGDKEDDPDGLQDLLSRMVRNETVSFYWLNRREAINETCLQKEQIVNHFERAGSFTTKVGLCVNLRNLHWFDAADPDTFFPRCYRLVAKDEKQAFIEDYRRTACLSLLKFVVEREKRVKGEETNLSEAKAAQAPSSDSRRRRRLRSRPVVLPQMIENALQVCQDFLESHEHGDIDKNLETPPQTLTNEEWAEFIESYYLVVHGGAELEDSGDFAPACKAMLQRMERVSPQLDIDGLHNIWIIKPGAKSRGRGIKCAKRLDQILKLVAGDATLIRESKWVVQKYMECPLLIHGTKFDVRQWFLVTDWNPLTVWFYKKCYMRFSTQPYSLDRLDSSVHLCNNSIQKHFTPSEKRHRGIPADNMWSDEQFRSFLSTQGREAQWSSVVVPGMKKALIHALQTTQDLMESRKNTFELYGADFMFGRDLRPWLIEINASPTMAPSTPVTARLCTAVQEDTLRVVLDRRVDRNAKTGDFQLIYRQATVEVPQYVGVNLLVEGFKIKLPHSLPPLRSSLLSAQKRRTTPIKDKEPVANKVPVQDKGPTPVRGPIKAKEPASNKVPVKTMERASNKLPVKDEEPAPSNNVLPVKDKEPAKETVKILPTMALAKLAEVRCRKTKNCRFPPPPSFPNDPHVHAPMETYRLHLPMTVNSSLSLPFRSPPQAMYVWKRRPSTAEESRERPCVPLPEKHQSCPPVLLKVDVTKQHVQQACVKSV